MVMLNGKGNVQNTQISRDVSSHWVLRFLKGLRMGIKVERRDD